MAVTQGERYLFVKIKKNKTKNFWIWDMMDEDPMNDARNQKSTIYVF